MAISKSYEIADLMLVARELNNQRSVAATGTLFWATRAAQKHRTRHWCTSRHTRRRNSQVSEQRDDYFDFGN